MALLNYKCFCDSEHAVCIIAWIEFFASSWPEQLPASNKMDVWVPYISQSGSPICYEWTKLLMQHRYTQLMMKIPVAIKWLLVLKRLTLSTFLCCSYTPDTPSLNIFSVSTVKICSTAIFWQSPCAITEHHAMKA
jgi:hypothetical protein